MISAHQISYLRPFSIQSRSWTLKAKTLSSSCVNDTDKWVLQYVKEHYKWLTLYFFSLHICRKKCRKHFPFNLIWKRGSWWWGWKTKGVKSHSSCSPMPLQYKIIMIVIIIISRNGTILSIIIIYHSKNIIIIIMAKSSSLASAESSQNPVPEREFTLPIPHTL